METKITTIDYLRKILNDLSERGYGDMKIKCQDNYLHEDEIKIDCMHREVTFHGELYNFPPTKKVKEFRNAVQKAYEKFWR